MLRQPAFGCSAPLGGVIVQDGVDARLVGHLHVDPVEDRGDLPAPVLLGAASDGIAAQDVQAGEHLRECRTQGVHPNFLGLRRFRTFEYCPSTVFQGLQSGLRRFSMVWFWSDFRGPENGGRRASGKQ